MLSSVYNTNHNVVSIHRCSSSTWPLDMIFKVVVMRLSRKLFLREEFTKGSLSNGLVINNCSWLNFALVCTIINTLMKTFQNCRILGSPKKHQIKLKRYWFQNFFRSRRLVEKNKSFDQKCSAIQQLHFFSHLIEQTRAKISQLQSLMAKPLSDNYDLGFSIYLVFNQFCKVCAI